MADTNLVRILDLYKDNKINGDEAEKMIKSVINSSGHSSDELPWKDDGKLRIVAYIGRKILKKGDPEVKNLEVNYDGKALNVECYGNLTCGDVEHNVSAGSNVTCGNIKGNVASGGWIRCKSVKGKVAALGGIQIEK